jgi:hypothetical protein
MKKQYLGDGVYVEFDPASGGVVLTTEDGIGATNQIFMEPEVIVALGDYIDRMAIMIEQSN